MIAHEVVTIDGLVRFVSSTVSKHCSTRRIPKLPVSRDDDVPGLSEFNFRKGKILVPASTASYLKHLPEWMRSWVALDIVNHELKHYEQYLNLSKEKTHLSRQMFNEDEAKLAGRLGADVKIGSMTPEEINPRELVPVRVTPPEKRIERVVPLKSTEDMTPEEYEREIRKREIPRRWRPNPMTIATVNAAVKRLGYPERLVKGEGYYYWRGGSSSEWEFSGVYVYHISELTLSEWIQDLEDRKSGKSTNPVFIREMMTPSKNPKKRNTGPSLIGFLMIAGGLFLLKRWSSSHA